VETPWRGSERRLERTGAWSGGDNLSLDLGVSLCR
jgi:hypothetical protein